MKKSYKLILIISLICLCFACLFACKQDQQITITVRFNVEGAEDITLSVNQGETFYNKLAELTLPDCDYQFDGWFDSDGKSITAYASFNEDTTIDAQWSKQYTMEYYFETDDGFDIDYNLSTAGYGKVGSVVNIVRKQISGFVVDETNTDNVTLVTLGSGSSVLKLYYLRQTVTISFDKNLTSAVGSMSNIVGKYGEFINLPQIDFTTEYDCSFVGWNTAADGSGESYSDGELLPLKDDLTLYAQWLGGFEEIIFWEQEDGNFEQYKKLFRTGIIGSTVTSQKTAPEGKSYYEFDTDNVNGVTQGVLTEQGLTLKTYFRLKTFTVTYAEDNAAFNVKYGHEYTIRTPDDASIISYCTSKTGNGREYEFGTEITVTQNITLYPVIIDIYTANDGSGDTVSIQRGMTGLGAAVLNRGGKEYRGFVTVDNASTYFDVILDDDTALYAKLLENNKFMYRNEEDCGKYLYFDYLDHTGQGVYSYVALALDGYGVGVFAWPISDGRIANYYCEYAKQSGNEYYMQYYLPAEPNKVYADYFILIHDEQVIEADGETITIDGYFMLRGAESGAYVLVYNRELQSTALSLDGYGNGEMFNFDADGNKTNSVKGVYYASEEYTKLMPEYVFAPEEGSGIDPFYFILQDIGGGEDAYCVFMIRRGEVGEYHKSASAQYPKIYLDGYGMAMYQDSASDKDGRYAYYTILSDGNGYKVVLEFADEIGGKMQVGLDTVNNLFSSLGEFVIADGVLVEYLGESTIIEIPEGVTEIPDNLFKDKNITTLTLPSTIQKIGKYAFQNSSSATSQSLLKTIYINAATPPELVDDPNSDLPPNPFRWLQVNAKIFVPDGCEEAYRAAESWEQYTNYITSVAEENNKPLYEIKDNVLVSYNNKDENPQNVAIVIPENVTEIADGVFAGMEYIVSVDLNNAVIIGNRAFYGCINITEITFNADTVSIGDEAFYQCSSLTELDLGNVQTIGDSAFNRCLSLAKVTIGSQIESIGSKAFSACSIEEIDTEEESTVIPYDFILTINSQTAPVMGGNVFFGTQPRIYVASFEVGVGYADETTWMSYVKFLRVKNEGETATLYAQTEPGLLLILDDRASFAEGSFVGLYKFDGDKLYITWFNLSYGSDFSTNLTVVEDCATLINGIWQQFTPSGVASDGAYCFVSAGKSVLFDDGAGQTLKVIYGSEQAEFNGHPVTMQIVNYKMRFDYDGYTYVPTLYNNNAWTFTRTKITVETSYAAADGSTLIIREGNSIVANGALADVCGVTGIRSEYWGWWLTKVSDNVYTWTVMWGNDRYSVTATVSGNTFTYVCAKASYVAVCRNSAGDVAAVTILQQTGEVSGVILSFKTANGSMACQTKSLIKQSDGTYLITVEGEPDEEGIECEFNGTYVITLDTANEAFTLIKQN